MSTETEITETGNFVCGRCYAVLDTSDNFCRHCGLPTRHPTPGAEVPGYPGHAGTPPPQTFSWSENPAFVLAMLFVILGPLALPLLWRSRQFSRFWKIALTVIVAGVTVYVGWALYAFLNHTLEPLRDLLKQV